MLHRQIAKNSDDPATDYKTRLGLKMFAAYCVFFAGFVLTNVLTEGEAMEVIVIGGLNLAVVYGMGLILVALILALVYDSLCTSQESSRAEQSADRSEAQASGEAS